jgi:hypothetical protein
MTAPTPPCTPRDSPRVAPRAAAAPRLEGPGESRLRAAERDRGTRRSQARKRCLLVAAHSTPPPLAVRVQSRPAFRVGACRCRRARLGRQRSSQARDGARHAWPSGAAAKHPPDRRPTNRRHLLVHFRWPMLAHPPAPGTTIQDGPAELPCENSTTRRFRGSTARGVERVPPHPH